MQQIGFAVDEKDLRQIAMTGEDLKQPIMFGNVNLSVCKKPFDHAKNNISWLAAAHQNSRRRCGPDSPRPPVGAAGDAR